MAGKSDVRRLVEQFVSDLERAVTDRVNGDFATRFDDLKRSILGGAAREPRPSGRRLRPGPRSGYKAELKPCPVCGTPNKARRFSYLCDKHRNEENLRKYKGAAKGAPATAPAKKGRARAKAPKAAAKKARRTAKTEAPAEKSG
jgi:hypothetical protein